MIVLRPIQTEDIVEIKKWPAYEEAFGQMDYALRDNGWIDEFRDRPDTRIYAAEAEGRLAGFSLLGIETGGAAEFRIAIHPQMTGKGLGRQVALATLEEGFRRLELRRIHLIVRKNNPWAAKLYESIGFKKTGESVHVIQGRHIEFADMDMTREKFDEVGQLERVTGRSWSRLQS